MTLLLHPRACQGDRVRIWIAADNCTSATALQVTWQINGKPSLPNEIRPMESARSADLLNGDEPRVFTGLYEFTIDGTAQPIRPSTLYNISASIEAGARTESLNVRTLPLEVPRGLGETFNIMLVSCFWVGRDATGIAGNIVSLLPREFQPHLTLLLGDQVYLDLPTLANFPDDEKALAKKFENAYLRNWTGHESGNPVLGGYASLLRAAPSIAIPDDHEFWNNFPHPSPFIQNSFTEDGRQRWKKAAMAMYRAFQAPAPGVSELATINVVPLSIGCLDARTNRQEDRSRSLSATALRSLRTWTSEVRDQFKFGMLATGQSLYDAPAGGLKGKVGDYTMASYGDFSDILDCVLAMSGNGMPATLVTGDVHWGRVLKTLQAGSDEVRAYEVISSPTSLVETVGADNFNQLKGTVAGLFGNKPDWPLHAKPDAAPDYFASRKSLPNKPLGDNMGNQIAILSVSRAGTGLTIKVTYFPLNSDASKNREKTITEPLNLKRTMVTHA